MGVMIRLKEKCHNNVRIMWFDNFYNRNMYYYKGLKLLWDDIKSSGKFAIFSYLKIEGEGGRRQITEKWYPKIKTVEYIDVKLTRKGLQQRWKIKC